jgi:hypothetical protein
MHSRAALTAILWTPKKLPRLHPALVGRIK